MMMGLVLAALIGLSLGLMGGGGSTLTVPTFVYVLGFGAKQSIVMSLPVVGVTSFVGAVDHLRRGNVRLRTGVSFGLIAMAGSYAGARLAVFIPGAVQLTLLAIVMIASATAMLRSSGKPDGAPIARAGMPGEVIQVAFARMAIAGVGVGLLTGMVGIGGGFLIVPALVILCNVAMKEAIGTSLLVIAMNSVAGFAGYYGTVALPWRFLAGFTVISASGVLAGSRLVEFVPVHALKRGFAVFLLAIATLMLIEN